MKKGSILIMCIIALVAFAVWAPNAGAYPNYQTANGALDNCSQCHPGFDAGFAGPLHSAHLVYTLACTACHTAPGAIPVLTGTSGTPGGLGCSGCHQGGGLQLHHTNADAPPDGNGLTCAICHPGATSPPESTPPAYYGDATITTIVDPCQSTPAPPGEDFGGGGLDNDGDLFYNEQDSDCAAGCTSNADCDDMVDCTVDTCDVASGVCSNTPDNGLCDDANVCNGTETCDPATGDPVTGCNPGTPLDCDDGIDCTVDSCDPVTGCANTPDDGLCDDADPCTVNICTAGVGCEFPPLCAPNETCVDGVCQPIGCQSDAECDDENVCNGAETCDTATGECLPGTPLNCDDGIGCTVDSCDPVNGCMNMPDDGLCDDDNVCNGAETCDPTTGDPVTGCNPGTPLDCDDGIDCTVDSCDPVTGCANTPDDGLCDDADPCTQNICTAGVGCEFPPLCAPNETCVDGVCQPIGCTSDDDCDDGLFCTVNTCDTTTGLCGAITACPPAIMGCVTINAECDEENDQCVDLADDTQCDDGVFCNGAETCDIDTGACLPGTPPDCDDGIDCTVDSCDLATDACMNTPDDTACPDDGLFCTGAPICDAAMGCGFTGDPCPEGTVCNEDTDTCDMVDEKVTICHIPPGNPENAKTLRIGAESVAAHLRHGDTLGPCPE